MINGVFWLLIVLIFLNDIFIIVGLLYSTDKNINNFINDLPISDTKIFNQKLYIVISLFNESKSINKTINYFSKFLCNNVRLMLVTTEKERKIFGNNKTLEKIDRILEDKGCEYISVINYPGKSGNKGAQLNYLLTQMKEELYSAQNYLVVYDCDSRPDESSILEMCELMQKGVNVIQQSTLYTQNFESVSSYMRIEGIFETIRSMGIERFNYYLSCLPFNRIIMVYAYCVGHGMCFNGKFLYDIGGFPEPNEDVPQGMKLMLLKQGIVPMISKDHGDVVKDIRMLFYQSGNWIKAPLQAFKIAKQINRIRKISVYRKILFCINVFFDFLSWFQYALLFMISIILIINSNYVGLLGIIVLIIFPIVQVLICCKIYRIDLSFPMAILAPFRNIFRSTAIFSFLYQKFRQSYNEIDR